MWYVTQLVEGLSRVHKALELISSTTYFVQWCLSIIPALGMWGQKVRQSMYLQIHSKSEASMRYFRHCLSKRKLSYFISLEHTVFKATKLMRLVTVINDVYKHYFIQQQFVSCMKIICRRYFKHKYTILFSGRKSHCHFYFLPQRCLYLSFQ